MRQIQRFIRETPTILFDVLPLLYEFTSFGGQSAPFFEVGSASNPGQGSYPNGAYSLIKANPKSFRVVWVQQDPKRNYVMQWNLDIQRQITPNLSASIGYVGSHGVHQPFRTDEFDMVVPTLTSAGYLWPAPIGSGTKLNPNFGDIRSLLWIGESSYNGLVAQVDKRLSHGVQLSGAFTWSKSLDTTSSTQEGDALYNSISSPHWFNLKGLNYGPSDFNIGRILSANVLWQVPGTKSDSRLLGLLANGWQIGSIIKLNDGPPFTPTWGTGGDPAGTLASDDWSYPDRLGGPGCKSLVNPGNPTNYVKSQCFSLPVAPNMAFWQANCDTTSLIYGSPATTEPYPICFNLRGNSGRNIANGPGLVNVDTSLFKTVKLTEALNAELRAEAFNVFNHTNFAPPGVGVGTAVPVDIFAANGTSLGNNPGTLLATTTNARTLQFALKLIW
jgi:hypothetical protein